VKIPLAFFRGFVVEAKEDEHEKKGDGGDTSGDVGGIDEIRPVNHSLPLRAFCQIRR